MFTLQNIVRGPGFGPLLVSVVYNPALSEHARQVIPSGVAIADAICDVLSMERPGHLKCHIGACHSSLGHRQQVVMDITLPSFPQADMIRKLAQEDLTTSRMFVCK